MRVGGHLILCLPANNLSGHGFYQFSAELFYSALSDQNGYAVERILICQDDFETVHRFRGRALGSPRYGPRYEVADPRIVRQRVGLPGALGNILMVEAKRTARKSVLEAPPEQSDYVRVWAGERISARASHSKDDASTPTHISAPWNSTTSCAAGAAVAAMGRDP